MALKRLAKNPVTWLWLVASSAIAYSMRGGYVPSQWIETKTVANGELAANVPTRAFPPDWIALERSGDVITLRWGDVAHSDGATVFTVQRMTLDNGRWVDTLTRDVGHSLNFIDTPPAGTHFYRVRSVILER